MAVSNNEEAHLFLLESVKTMVSTDAWKLLTETLLIDEMNCLASLYNYLASTLHPDREDVITLCLNWHAKRSHRRLLLENVRDCEKLTKPEPLSEEAQTMIADYGEM